jgi:hypothetical protein
MVMGVLDESLPSGSDASVGLTKLTAPLLLLLHDTMLVLPMQII